MIREFNKKRNFMLMVNYRAWKSSYILVTLVVLTLLFALVMPQPQKFKNQDLFDAVVENNVTKAKALIAKGAEVNILLPTGFPLISLAIEYENEKMLSLLMLDAADLSRKYKGYDIIDHAAGKKNKNLLKMIVQALERREK